MASRMASRWRSAASVSSTRASMFACILTGSIESSSPRDSKIGPNSPIDRFARVTICLATGARSAW